MINAIWDSVIHCISEWRNQTKKGKILLENNQKTLEPCLQSMVTHKQNTIILKLQSHQSALFEDKVKDQRKIVVLAYLERVIEMMRLEFDLKVCLSMQISGTFNKRKLLTYVWVTEPHIDDGFLNALPKTIEN